MKCKFVIFVIIGALLIAAIYNTSAVVYGIKACWISNDGKLKFCTNSVTKTWWECHANSQGTWDCVKFSASSAPVPSTDLPPDVKNALDAAIRESQNTTKVPKTGIIDDGGILKEQGDNQNQTTSERIIDPEDRFCKQGTGPRLGTPCVPCNPGEANCIDQVTGGLLDMPDAATSESEEEDDTNPKDLGGLNNDDENGPKVNPGTD